MRLIARADPGFEQVCVGRLFNARKPERRRPKAVLVARGDEDVQARDLTRRPDRCLADAHVHRLEVIRIRRDPAQLLASFSP